MSALGLSCVLTLSCHVDSVLVENVTDRTLLTTESDFEGVEVPVTWRNDARSTVGPIVDSSRMLADVLRVRWRFRRGLYNPEIGVRS